MGLVYFGFVLGFFYPVFSPDLLAKVKRSEFVLSAKGSVLVQLGLALVPYSC